MNELLAAFQARCVRAYAIADDGNYAVSELELWDTSNQPVSIGKVVFGIEPYVTNGAYAPEGTANNDARYASVLAATGTCGR